jgi:hypothetical protein
MNLNLGKKVSLESMDILWMSEEGFETTKRKWELMAWLRLLISMVSVALRDISLSMRRIRPSFIRCRQVEVKAELLSSSTIQKNGQ